MTVPTTNPTRLNAVVLGLILALAGSAAAQVVTVDGRRLLVDGVPFTVQGVAGAERMAELKALGGNTARTYGADPDRVLAEAGQAGVKVILGFWLEHPRRGFDYADRGRVDAQLAALRDLVLRHKDHPALLLWGIGNEVESELDDSTMVWPAIEEAAKLVKSLDPKHPTMAVLAETGGDKVRHVMTRAPSIDVLGINSYGDNLLDLPLRVRAQGWTGPLLVTELGALGQWQAPRTPWGAAIEPTSTAKAARLRGYLAALRADTAGQLLFLWGHKQEVTPTWHSLLLPTGEWIEASEVMAAAWGGATPGGNRAPRIVGLDRVDDQALLVAIDPDGDPLAAEWRLLEESTDLRKAGDAETVPPDRSAALRSGGVTGVRIGPLPPGNYRLFVTVRDGRGAAATGNLPFQR